jgi:tRNA 5-methylaminomethyl-2-thiouridine biosynthesis bifunctional protein
MPSPRPLTLCPPAQLDWSRPGTPAAPAFGDIYFSTDGGLQETRTVFLKGCGLPDAWQGTVRFVIAELGFGSGLNFLATWQMWDQSSPENGHLHFVSIEKFPFDQDQLTRALNAWPELKTYAEQLIRKWPGRVRGFHRLHFGNVTLTLIHDDIENALNEMSLRADAWFLDGFSPSKNPDMWSPSIMKQIAALSSEKAKLATFTVAGSVKRALTEAGFIVERKTGFGRKRHRLEAVYSKKFSTPLSYAPKEPPTIIGTGIAGLSLAKAFLRRGVTPRLIEDPDHIAASGNKAALIKPRLDLQDRPESRFFLASYLYALQTYQNAVLDEGILHIPKTDKESLRHQKILEQCPLPEQHLMSESQNRLNFAKALTISPEKYRDEVLEPVDIDFERIEALETLSGPVFLATGFGIKSLLPTLPLRFSRGQITLGQASPNLKHPVSYGGYAAAVEETVLIGATHDRLVSGENPFTVKTEDDVRNKTSFEHFIGGEFSIHSSLSRASVRVTSKDTLPVVGQLKDNIYVLTGLGSRGFVFAPLLAEAIVSEYFGDPLPISRLVWEKFSTARLFNYDRTAETFN